MNQEVIWQAVESLRRAAPGAKIILYGSQARGEATEESDLDFLVVQPGLTEDEKVNESIRLRRAIGAIGVGVDVLVTSPEWFDYWRDTPGHIYYEAAIEGKVFEPLP